MRISTLLRLTLPAAFLGLLGGAAPQPSSPQRSPTVAVPTKLTGDYVEARTASVFAGGCHYNGELVTTGNDAILALKIAAGSWNGTDLAGTSAMAAISSEDNLGNDAATRQSEIVVNASATPAQATALADLMEKQSAHRLGKIVAIRHGMVLFDHTGSTYTVKSAGFAEMTVQAMPNGECCKQPSLVWYSPLVPLLHRKVGYTISSSYSAGTVGDPWSRSEENTAFYGAFQF
jgi:hypothetical protein